VNGFNGFYPEQIQDNLYVPRVAITDFKLFNKLQRMSASFYSNSLARIAIVNRVALSVRRGACSRSA